MSKSNAKKLVDKLSKDQKFREALLEEEEKAALKFAKKAGLECTAEELKGIFGGELIGPMQGRWMGLPEPYRNLINSAAKLEKIKPENK